MIFFSILILNLSISWLAVKFYSIILEFGKNKKDAITHKKKKRFKNQIENTNFFAQFIYNIV